MIWSGNAVTLTDDERRTLREALVVLAQNYKKIASGEFQSRGEKIEAMAKEFQPS